MAPIVVVQAPLTFSSIWGKVVLSTLISRYFVDLSPKKNLARLG